MAIELVRGAVVAGRYRLDRPLGEGGMGVVWAARHLVTRSEVAMKFLNGPERRRVEHGRRFLREARAACAVKHPGVVQIHDVLEHDGSPVIVMELLRGESLGRRFGRERIATPELYRILLRAVSAVGAAHAAGIVHRDLKPDNVYLVPGPGGETGVKVLDFGIAKIVAPDDQTTRSGQLTAEGAMLGTPYYMSPEQALGEQDVDHRTDIWSLGVILYQGLSGLLPTRAGNIGQVIKRIAMSPIRPIEAIVPDLPPEVARLVGRMMAVQPDERPADLREVKEVLERHAGITAIPFGEPRRAQGSHDEPADEPVAEGTAPLLPTHPSLSATVSATRPPWSMPRVATGALAGTLAAAVAVVGWRVHTRQPLARAEGGAVRSSPEASTAGVVEEQATADALPTSAPSAPAAPAPCATPTSAPAKRPPLSPAGAWRKTATVPPTAPSTPSKPARALNCDPPVTVDADGIQHLKPECMQ